MTSSELDGSVTWPRYQRTGCNLKIEKSVMEDTITESPNGVARRVPLRFYRWKILRDFYVFS